MWSRMSAGDAAGTRVLQDTRTDESSQELSQVRVSTQANAHAHPLLCVWRPEGGEHARSWLPSSSGKWLLQDVDREGTQMCPENCSASKNGSAEK